MKRINFCDCKFNTCCEFNTQKNQKEFIEADCNLTITDCFIYKILDKKNVESTK